MTVIGVALAFPPTVRQVQVEKLIGYEADIVARLGRLEVSLAHIEAAVHRLQPPSRVSRTDLAVLRVLLPGLAQEFQGTAFTSREALQVPRVRALYAGSVKSLGRLLSRADGVEVNGFGIDRIGTDAHVSLWTVRGPSGLSGVFGPIGSRVTRPTMVAGLVYWKGEESGMSSPAERALQLVEKKIGRSITGKDFDLTRDRLAAQPESLTPDDEAILAFWGGTRAVEEARAARAALDPAAPATAPSSDGQTRRTVERARNRLRAITRGFISGLTTGARSHV